MTSLNNTIQASITLLKVHQINFSRNALHGHAVDMKLWFVEEGSWCQKDWCILFMVLEKISGDPPAQRLSVHSEGDRPLDFVEGGLQPETPNTLSHFAKKVELIKRSVWGYLQNWVCIQATELE